MSEDKPVLVFSDGACEEEGSSIGALCVAPGEGAQCFGAMVSKETVDSWKSKAEQKQIIGQAELFPLLVARLTWKEMLSSKKVIYFVDNESARLSMIKAYSPVLPSLHIVIQCLEWDYKHESVAWYARGPSASKPGDAPSRLCFPSCGVDVKVVAPIFPPGHSPDSFLKDG